MVTTPSLRVYPFYICPAAQLGLVPYQNHIKPIYGPYMAHPHSKNWTLDFAPAVSSRFSFPLSPRSIFHTAQRFLLPNHVTSGLGAVTSGSGHVTSGHVTSGEPAILPHGQRFWAPDPLSNPRSAVALPVSNPREPIRSQEIGQMGPHYYYCSNQDQLSFLSDDNKKFTTGATDHKSFPT